LKYRKGIVLNVQQVKTKFIWVTSFTYNILLNLLIVYIKTFQIYKSKTNDKKRVLITTRYSRIGSIPADSFVGQEPFDVSRNAWRIQGGFLPWCNL